MNDPKLRWRDKLKEFRANFGKSPDERIKFKIDRVGFSKESKAKILCSIHACCSMAEARRLVAAGGFEKALKAKGVQQEPGVPMAFDVSNVIEEEELKELLNLLKEKPNAGAVQASIEGD